MKHINENAIVIAATRIWSVKRFCQKERLDEKEEAKLIRLFGPFATAAELLYNAKRESRWRI